MLQHYYDVPPVTMDDLTSGFNVGTNYSLSPEFNEMMGFTESEVREMLTYYSTTTSFKHTIDELIEIMKPWYDNYCFAKDCYGDATLYNSNMVLYFVKNYIQYGKVPKNMAEDNWKSIPTYPFIVQKDSLHSRSGKGGIFIKQMPDNIL